MKKNEFTIKKSKVECYKVRHETGMFWADITVDVTSEKSGRIMIASDFGSWDYYWGDTGPTFKEFLTRVDRYYVSNKFGANRWFDLDSTLEGYKKRVLECRKDENISADEAREIYNEIKELEGCSGENEFVSMMWTLPKLMSFYDGTPDMVRTITPGFREFWESVWPVFVERLKEEIEEEKKDIKEVNDIMEQVSFQGELIISLESKNEWVRKIPGYLPPIKHFGESFLFIDKNGNTLAMGEDFSAAERMESYPVKVYRKIRVIDAERLKGGKNKDYQKIKDIKEEVK